MTTERAGTGAPPHETFDDLEWPTNKSLLIAYLLWLPPCGLLGLHHFYLHRREFGFLYLFTLGGLGMGWLRDLFVLPHTVKSTNRLLATTTGEGRRKIAKRLPYLVNHPRGELLAEVREETGYWENGRGHKLFYHARLPKDRDPKAVIFQCVGYTAYNSGMAGVHARRLALEGYAVYGIDYEGHGLSDGIHAYIPDFDALVDDLDRYFAECKAKHPDLKCFMLGESMGGAVSLLLHFLDNARAEKDLATQYDAAILMAPMVKISEKVKPPPFVERLFKGVARHLPLAPITPTKDVIDFCFQDKELVKDSRLNPLLFPHKPRLGTALEMLRSSGYCEANLGKVTLPFLLLHGSDDHVTDPEISQALYETAASSDKTFNKYPKQWHVLLFEPKGDVVFQDILDWMEKRS